MRKAIEEKEFLERIRINRGVLFKICNIYCVNREDREDLAQEIVYQLWRSGASFDDSYRFSIWMYRVALNVAISYYRSTKRDDRVLFKYVSECYKCNAKSFAFYSSCLVNISYLCKI